MVVEHIIYAVAWLSFGLVHSLLASNMAKKRIGALLGPYYRLAYNLFAAVYISMVLAIGHIYVEPTPYNFPAPVGYILYTIQIAGVIIMVAGARGYDLGLFAGTRQIRDHRRGIGDLQDEPLVLDGLHRHVRHPIYSGAFLFLWGGVDSSTALATAVWGSIYLIVGTYFEERKLLAIYGEEYADYCRKTPTFVPWAVRVK